MLSADDRFAILDLYSAYNFTIDTGDDEGWVQLFTRDGIFLGTREVVGHEGLRAFRAEQRANADALPYYQSQHWNSSLIVRERDGHVQGFCYIMRTAVERATKQPAVVMQGCYEDTLVRVDDGSWRFASRITHRTMQTIGQLLKD